MKRLTFLTVIMMLAVCAMFSVASPPYTNLVTATSTTVLPPRNYQSASNWQGGVVWSKGDYCTNKVKEIYMALNAGTSGGTGPTNLPFGDTDDGGVTWRRVLTRTPRKGFAIVNNSTNSLYLSIDFPAVLNGGIRLNANGGSFSSDGDSIQGEINMIGPAATTNSVTSQDW